MLVGGGVALRLELDEAHEGVRGAVGGLRLRPARAPAPRRAASCPRCFHQERLLDQHVVAGIVRQRLPVVGGGGLACRSGRAPPGRRGSCRAASASSMLACRCLADAGSRRCLAYPSGTPDRRAADTHDEHRIASAHVTSCRERLMPIPDSRALTLAGKRSACDRKNECRELCAIVAAALSATAQLRQATASKLRTVSRALPCRRSLLGRRG